MFIGNFKDDDYMQESFTPFIKQRQNTNILNSLVTDENARATISEQFVQNFASKGKKSLITEFHLQWALECIGYSFFLPAKRYYNTIQISITLYSDWLNFPDYAPDLIKSSRSHYIQEILGHMSLAFYPQKDVSKQVEVCIEILNSLDKFTNGQVIDEGSWMCLLKISLEIGNVVVTNFKLSEFIGSRILKFIFQMFLKTSTRDLGIWEEFKEFLNRFCENQWVCVYWAACLQGLSKKVIKLLMGKNNKFLVVSFFGLKMSQDEFVLDKDPEAIIYLWSRFLNVFEWQKLEINANRCNIVLGVCASIKLFLQQAQKLNSPKQLTPPPYLIISTSSSLNSFFAQNYQSVIKYLNSEFRLPSFSVNSLLSSFGSLLFSLVSESKYSNPEKIESLSVLCKIFEKAQGPISLNYIENFLSCVILCATNKDSAILSVIIEGFKYLPSVSIHFVNFALKTDIIVQITSYFLLGNQSSVQTRRSSLGLLSVFSTLTSFYNISGLCQQISDIYMVTIEVETDEKCFEVLMWSIASYLACFKGDMDIMNVYLKVITEKLEILDASTQNYFTLIDILTALPYMVNSTCIKVETVSYCIKRMLNLLYKRVKNPEEQIFRIFQCIVDYLICFPAVLLDAELKFEILKAVETRRIEDKVRNFQNYLHDHIFSKVGKLCRDKCAGLNQDFEDSVEFHTENIHGCFIENDKEIQVVVKNSTGEYFWKIREVLSKENSKKIEERLKIDLIQNEKNCNQVNTQENIEISLSEFEQNHRIFDKFNNQQSICTNFQTFSSLKKPPQLQNPVPNTNSLKIFRKLITQHGYLDLNSPGFFFNIDKSSNSAIKQYTSLPTSTLYSVKLIYLPTIETSSIDCMSQAQPYSNSYQNFLNHLGTVLTELDPCPPTCQKVLKKYKKGIFRDLGLFETIFTSPSLFNEDFKIDLLDFVEFGQYIVIWNERMNDKESLKVPGIVGSLIVLQKPIVVITPICEDIVKINSFNLENGLLVDGMVISCKALWKILLFSVHFANQKFSQRFSIWKNRFNYLKELAVKTSRERLSIGDLTWIF